MFIASTVNPMSMSKIDVPVVVLTYGKESELVEVPVAYKHLKGLAMRVFGINGSSANFTFRTSSLDICQGRSVRIHESAWEAVRLFVAEIQVSVSDSKGHATVRNVASGQTNPIPEDYDRAPFPRGQEVGENSSVEYQEFLEDKNEVEQLAGMASVMGSAADSDDEHEMISEQNPSNKSDAFEQNPTDEEDDGEDAASATAHHIKTEPAGSERLSQEQGNYSDAELSDVGDAQGSEANGELAERPAKTEQLSVKGLPVTGSRDAIDSSQSQTQPEAEDVEARKYIIRIEYPPKGYVVMFKVRNTYTVKKVLARTCENFELDFALARLKLIVEIDDEEGGELLSDCDNGVTMAMAGAVPNSRFIIIMDHD